MYPIPTQEESPSKPGAIEGETTKTMPVRERKMYSRSTGDDQYALDRWTELERREGIALCYCAGYPVHQRQRVQGAKRKDA